MSGEVQSIIDDLNKFAIYKGRQSVVETFEDIILLVNNAELSYNFCLNFNNADILKHQRIIIESKSAKYCYLFARNINDSDIDLLEKAIYDSGDEYYVARFKKDIKWLNVEVPKKVVDLNDLGERINKKIKSLKKTNRQV